MVNFKLHQIFLKFIGLDLFKEIIGAGVDLKVIPFLANLMGFITLKMADAGESLYYSIGHMSQIHIFFQM